MDEVTDADMRHIGKYDIYIPGMDAGVKVNGKTSTKVSSISHALPKQVIYCLPTFNNTYVLYMTILNKNYIILSFFCVLI